MGVKGRRIAMWSGPRHISTALMRAWENRPDTLVVDEPLYAHYLKVTEIDHPMRAEILRALSSDWRTVVADLTAEQADDTIYYQKHMAHHLTPEIEWDWIEQLDNCFLIRDPREVVRSYHAKRDEMTPNDLGYVQQLLLFEHLRARTGKTPPVIDIQEVLDHPKPILEDLCRRLGVPFYAEMLHWSAGRRESDGIWGAHWYGAVEKSTGFTPLAPRAEALTEEQEAIAASCRPFYEKLAENRIH
jgi:hypothetical protein